MLRRWIDEACLESMAGRPRFGARRLLWLLAQVILQVGVGDLPRADLFNRTTVSSSTDPKCGVPGASAMKIPAGIALTLLGSAFSPLPIRKIPEITMESPGFESVCGATR
jgi:hypothetical protein